MRVVEVFLPTEHERSKGTVGGLFQERGPRLRCYVYLELGVDLAEVVLQDLARNLAVVVPFVVHILELEPGVPYRLTVGGLDRRCLERVGGFSQVVRILGLLGIIAQ